MTSLSLSQVLVADKHGAWSAPAGVIVEVKTPVTASVSPVKNRYKVRLGRTDAPSSATDAPSTARDPPAAPSSAHGPPVAVAVVAQPMFHPAMYHAPQPLVGMGLGEGLIAYDNIAYQHNYGYVPSALAVEVPAAPPKRRRQKRP